MKCQFKKKYAYIGFQLINIGTSIYIPLLTKEIIDSIMIGSYLRFKLSAIKYIIVLIIFIITLALSNYFKTLYEENLIMDYRIKLYEFIGYAPFSKVSDNNVGYFISRFNDDIEKIRPFIVEIPLKKFTNIIVVLTIFIIMLMNNIYFTLALCVGFPLFFFIQKKMTDKLKEINKQIQLDKEALNTYLEEYVKYNYTIRVNNAIAAIITKNISVLNSYVEDVIRMLKIDIVYDYFLATGLLNIVSVIVYVFGGYLAIVGSITIGTLTMFSLYYSKLWSPLEFYIGYPKMKAENEVYMSRLNEILTYYDYDMKVSNKDFTFEYLKLKDVSIFYDTKIILDNISMVINSKDKIGLQGGNGSGKTTIANILARIQKNYTGEIYINDIPYPQIGDDKIRQMIRLIPAKPDIFYGTVKENITMFQDKSISNVETIIKALESNGITLDLIVGGNLNNLSGGEQKMIQLARGLVFDADIYIIDEPLNFVDVKHKETLLTLLTELFNKKTLIVISHDADAFKIVDKIYFINDKKLEVK